MAQAGRGLEFVPNGDKPKTRTAQGPQQKKVQSWFSVLNELEEEVDLEQNLEALKKTNSGYSQPD